MRRSSYSKAFLIILSSNGTVEAFTFPRQYAYRMVRIYAEMDPKFGIKDSIVSAEEAEYQFNEADFKDYSSDYSTPNQMEVEESDAYADEDEDYFDDDNDFVFTDDIVVSKDKTAIDVDYDLTPFEQHAREVFLTYAEQVRSTLDLDADSPKAVVANNAILQKDLHSMLQTLDIDATPSESQTLFKYLDSDQDGFVTLQEFLPWYAQSVDKAQQTAVEFQNLVKSRRTVHKFDATEVDDGVLRRALECAIAAPNRRGTEPWRFVKLGKETVNKVVQLREQMQNEQGHVDGSFVSWTKVPHWIVVTYLRAAPESGYEGKLQQREDFKSTCCAVQNFLLSMWSEGIGTKWTDGPIQRTEEFAKICGIDLEKEKVAGVIWYGFAKGGLKKVEARERRKGVEEVLDILP